MLYYGNPNCLLGEKTWFCNNGENYEINFSSNFLNELAQKVINLIENKK
jgi:hypothetical protein